MAAIHEFVQPVCGECEGSGLAPGQKATNLNAERCIKCHGTGRKPISTRNRCKTIGIGHKSYTNSHDDITKELPRLIVGWESDIFKNIREKMGEVA